MNGTSVKDFEPYLTEDYISSKVNRFTERHLAFQFQLELFVFWTGS
jgi:hypothetical protein